MINSLITGVDIGHYSIKAVVIKPVKGTLTLSACRELIIRDDIFSDNHQLNHQEIVNKLKELRKALPIFSQTVAISVPDNSVISKLIQIDKALSVQEKEYAIIEGFSHQSPFDVTELYLDHCDLASLSSESDQQSVQVYATKKAIVDSRCHAFQLAGFKPLFCDAHSHGLVRLWQQAAQNQARYDWMLLELGQTNALLVRDFITGSPWCKELAVGTRSITKQPQSELWGDAVEAFANELVAQIERQWQRLAREEQASIRGVWLSGGGANVPFIAQALQLRLKRRLGLECQLLNPLELVDDSAAQGGSSDSSSYGPSYGAALGVALLGLDWLRGSGAA